MKNFFKTIFLIFLLASAVSSCDAGVFAEDEDPLLGVKEGWAWPVVVIPPKDGWDSAAGKSIKYAMRTAEREISLRRDAIRGREVTFMFSDIGGMDELLPRLETWRAMKVSAIVSFAQDDFSAVLAELCGERGPSVIFTGGEGVRIRSEDTGKPRPYLFALDLPYYSRANAIAEAILTRYSGEQTAVVTDILSQKLARGAELNIRFLRARGLQTLDLSVTAYRQDQFLPQVLEAGAGGTKVFVCWLDAMAALSIWQNTTRRRSGAVVCYYGPAQQILTDADGMIVVDKDAPLVRNEEGRRAIMMKIRDVFDVIVEDPVTAARALAAADWVIGAYHSAGADSAREIALALERRSGIPLMDEVLSIDPGTHRPVSRKFGVLEVRGRTYESSGTVEVLSSETVE
ncbi:MAG: ABC transporter substrate-binding protein [Synergistaceae bacterium]|jgi:hypothetical protein|nr:ABC transporter substrate-binding protein [Synergistaceae bacterium]